MVKNQTTNLTPNDFFGHNVYVNLQMDMLSALSIFKL
jgi:hypothetical protein